MKIIASDYDGTLNHGGIDDEKIKAISDWRNAGNIFAIISGRSPKDLLRIFDEKRFGCDYLIADNGAVVMTTDGKIISKASCDGALAVPLIELILNSGCDWAYVQTDNDFRVYADAQNCKNDNEFTLTDMPKVKYFNQINTILPDFQTAADVTSKIASKFEGELNPLQNGNCIDIVRNDMNKAKGIYALMDIVDAKYEDVIAVGDNINDRDMIAEFRSYAMENGVDSIKESADYITTSITELIRKEL